VVAFLHADLGVRATRDLLQVHEGRDARQVALQRQAEHVVHRAAVRRELARDARRALEVRGHHDTILCGERELALEFAHRVEVLLELLPVALAEVLAQALHLGADEVEQRFAARTAFLRARRARGVGRVAEETLEQQARIDLGRRRLCRRLPRQVEVVRTGIAGVALTRVLAELTTQFERTEARLVADRGRDHLVGRDADLRLRAVLHRLNARQEHRRRARVVTGAVAVRARLVVHEARQSTLTFDATFSSGSSVRESGKPRPSRSGVQAGRCTPFGT
jgi:hypothetical protein